MPSERRSFQEIRQGNTLALYKLLQASSDELTARDELGDTLLTFACKMAQLPCVEVLLDAGADIDAPGEHDLAPLWWALRCKARLCLELLLARGANVRGKSKFRAPLLEEVGFFDDPAASTTALLLAARQWDQDELDRGLLRAAEQRRVGVLKQLIAAGANVNYDLRSSPEPDQGVFVYPTPLSAAVSGSSVDAVQTLLDSGVDINRRGTLGDTVLHLLAKDRTIPIGLFSKLIFSGAAVDIKNDNGETASDVARKAKNGLFCRIVASPREQLLPYLPASERRGTAARPCASEPAVTVDALPAPPSDESAVSTPAPPAPKRKTRRRSQEEQVYQLYYWEKVVTFVTRGPMAVTLPVGQKIGDYVRENEERLCEQMSDMPVVEDKDVDRKGGVKYERVEPGRQK